MWSESSDQHISVCSVCVVSVSGVFDICVHKHHRSIGLVSIPFYASVGVVDLDVDDRSELIQVLPELSYLVGSVDMEDSVGSIVSVHLQGLLCGGSVSEHVSVLSECGIVVVCDVHKIFVSNVCGVKEWIIAIYVVHRVLSDDSFFLASDAMSSSFLRWVEE